MIHIRQYINSILLQWVNHAKGAEELFVEMMSK